MDASADRPQFAPPPQPGMLRAFVLAVLAHLLLLFALMHGLQWKRETQDVVAEAELWSALPQQAAPPEVVAPPPPPPPPVAAPPVVRAPPLPDPQVQRDAQIAIEREKKQREAEKREAAEKAAERREEAERRKAELERDRQRKAEAQRKREEAEEKKQEQARAVAEAKRKDDEKKRRQQEADAKKLAQLREDNLKRMQGMAGTGSASSTGAAAQSSGPSATWTGRVIARVRPNIVFTESVAGNPRAEVEVRTSPDGTIVAKRLVRSSGVKAWDDAVLRALDKTESLPRDTDGRVPSPVILGFRPQG